ncbi:MAG: hypothetical protein EAZ06_07805 [Cytophagales bacterium]|nr:MAG: hypothetical protein EAZ06_07805 [Cytophagales bacterium]
MIMNKKIKIITLFLLLSMPILAQNTLFLSRLELQTGQPMLFPDYFKESQLGDSIRNEVHQLWKKVLNIQEVASRKSPAIDYTPVVSREKPIMRSINQTNFTYIAWIMAEIKADNQKKGKLIIESEVFDKFDRKIWRNKIIVPIYFEGKAFDNNEVMMSKDDLKKIFFYGLQKLFKQKIVTQKFNCLPPIDFKNKLFFQEADSSEIIIRNRGIIDWISRIGTKTLTLQLNPPFKKDEMYVRTATFENSLNQKKYQLQAHKVPKRQFEKQIDFYEQNVSVGSFVFVKATNNYGWIGNGNRMQLMLDIDTKTQKIQFFINKTNLAAVLVPILKEKELNSKEIFYKLYFFKTISEEQKAWFFNILLANSLSESVESFYKTETEGYKPKD